MTMRRPFPVVLTLLCPDCDTRRAATRTRHPRSNSVSSVAGERPTYLRSAQLAVDEINAYGGAARQAR